MVAEGMAALREVMSGGEPERMETHFKSPEPEVASFASARMAATQGGLATKVPINVDLFCPDPQSWGKNPVAFVPVVKSIGFVGDIHLLPAFFEQSADDRAATILHEATHKYAGTVDHAYFGDAAYPNLSIEESLENADSYAAFAQARHGDARREERADEASRERQLAFEHGPELWERYKNGDLDLWESSHELESGEVISPYSVALGLVDWLVTTRPAPVAEVEAAIGSGQIEGPLTCSDGTVIRDDLFRELYARLAA